jgi:hypothetical protein
MCRFYLLLTISLVCGLASLARPDEATEAAARRKADELIAQAEKLTPNLTGKGMPNLHEARLQAETRVEMERLLSEAVEAAPTYATAYLVRGKYRLRSDIFGGQSDLEMVRKLAPQIPESYLLLSQIASRCEDFAQAKKLAAEAYSGSHRTDAPQALRLPRRGELFDTERYRRAGGNARSVEARRDRPVRSAV